MKKELRRSPRIPHIPGTTPVGFCCRTCQQRIAISLDEHVWTSGDSPDTAGRLCNQDPHSEEPDIVTVLRPLL